MGMGIHASQGHVDTLAWAVGSDRVPCACAECWSHVPLWRYVQLLESHWRRRIPGGGPASLAEFVWGALSASRLRLAAWGYTAPGLAGAVMALRDLAARGGWNRGQLYEIAVRGLARNAGEAPSSGR